MPRRWRFRPAGRPLAALIAELIWQPIGAEADALMILDTAGEEIAGTGFTAPPHQARTHDTWMHCFRRYEAR